MGLTQLNVWLDAVFVTLYVVVLLGLSGHFIGNILTGRAKRRFGKEWAWPHHDSHPPALPKFLHFQHVASMIALAVSGLYIRFPFFDGGRTAMRWVHYVAMIIVTINLIWRLWYAFSSRQRDYREFAVTKRDITTAPQVILYYIFVKKSKPHLGKYNVMQKSTYILFAPLLILQAFTGFALLTMEIPIIGMSPRDLLVGWWLGVLLGSTDLAGWWARTAHYIINWLFIILTSIHVYLSVTEDFPAFLDFFGMGFLDKRSAHGGDHEDEHANEPAPAYASAEHG
ncbi:MAG TPA: cytochrome b/b6 domain-containing protein [Coriobacteriia bacterium]|nr:cytochrome b/b6 domain-containing protein [Coriobacteriia bacterium]